MSFRFLALMIAGLAALPASAAPEQASRGSSGDAICRAIGQYGGGMVDLEMAYSANGVAPQSGTLNWTLRGAPISGDPPSQMVLQYTVGFRDRTATLVGVSVSAATVSGSNEFVIEFSGDPPPAPIRTRYSLKLDAFQAALRAGAEKVTVTVTSPDGREISRSRFDLKEARTIAGVVPELLDKVKAAAKDNFTGWPTRRTNPALRDGTAECYELRVVG